MANWGECRYNRAVFARVSQATRAVWQQGNYAVASLGPSHLVDVTPEVELAEDLFDALKDKTADPPGITRPTYGEGETLAHDLAAQRARALNLEITYDFAGNQYMTLPGADRSKPRIMIGSHMDSVPHGGNFDGAAGVVMGLAALARLRRQGRTPERDITVMAIRAEETCWFSTHYIGSRMAFGRLTADELVTCRRMDTGRTLAEHLQESGFDPEPARSGTAHLDPAGIRCFIEPHIEQGPTLIGKSVPLGIVTGIRGTLRYKDCRVEGEYNHAGAVPREFRRDAVFAATEFAQVLEAHWSEREKAGADFVCTIGALFTDASQHAMTKISGDVRFTMDIRSIDNGVLMETDAFLRNQAARIGRERKVSVELGPYANGKPAVMDSELRGLLHAQAERLGIATLDMASGAGHDCSIFANEGVPSAMIFIRNDCGSHNPDEAMDMEDFAAGTRLLCATLDQLG